MAPPRKRDVKRGAKPSTLKATVDVKVTFKDEQPPDRYNLVFYADYADKDAVLEAVDEAYVRVYHERFPDALDSYTSWASKSPGSRVFCKADLIKQVATLKQIAHEIKQFIADHRDKPKKFGTIILTGHGNPEEFSLPLSRPIAKGGKRLQLKHLEVGLRYADSLSDTPPKEWAGDATLWKELKGDLMDLQVELDMLDKWLDPKWTDEQTLLRCWCCNLGKPPSGPKDQLEILGRMFLRRGKFMVEAPRNKSGNFYRHFSLPASAGPGTRSKIFRGGDEVRELWHPDTVSEVESDKDRIRLKGDDLASAQADFIELALRDAPPPGRKGSNQWIPAYYVDDEKKKPVYPHDWDKFAKLWRRISV